MSKKIELFSTVKNGKLQPKTTKEILSVLDGLEGKRVIVTIEKLSSKRSLEQNRYIHVLFTMLKDALNDLGNDFTMDEIKELCKAKFALIDVINEESGEIIGQRIKGTSEMNKIELNEFFESIIRWAAETFNIKLPYPNEQLEII
jgi:hypothetical protein